MAWVVFIIIAAFSVVLIRTRPAFRLPGFNRNTTTLLFLLKVAAGFALWYVYTVYYPDRTYADIWKFYDDSAIMHEAVHENPGDFFSMLTGIGIDNRIEETYLMRMNHWHQPFESNLFNDSHTIIRFNAMVRIFSLGNYHTHTLIMCLLSFMGLGALYRWAYKIVPHWKRLLLFTLFLLPSLVFWSSGVLKEGLMLFALGIFIEQFWKYLQDKKKVRIIYILLAAALLAITKLYMLAFLAPAIIMAIWLRIRPGFGIIKFVIVIIALFGTGKLIEHFRPQLSPARILAMKHNDFVRLAHGGTYMYNDTVVVYLEAERRSFLVCTNGDSCTLEKNTPFSYWRIEDNFADTLKSEGNTSRVNYKVLTDIPKAGSIIDNRFLKPDFTSILLAIPKSAMNVVLRPYPWEARSALIFPSLLENLFIVILLIAAFFFRRNITDPRVFWFCVTLAAINIAVIGLTTPVLGAIVRYRITALPFLIIALLQVADREKLIRKWPILARFL
ncbi:MAG: hypothetical protein L6Q81_03850 [Bacteroidia bacterium]|nr:hypothetical protein [Bacteroidia bacterium]